MPGRRSNPTNTWRVPPPSDGQRLTAFLRERLGPPATLAAVKQALARGRCTVDGRIETFGSRKLRPGERVCFHGSPSAPAERELVIRTDRILYEDDHLLAYDKPPGFPSLATGGRPRANLNDALVAFMAERGTSGLIAVHRLDRDTSGVILFARTPAAAKVLEDIFRARQVAKEYEAVVDGIPSGRGGEIVSHLRKATGGGPPRWQSVRTGGKRAETEYEVMEALDRAALVRLRPRTGRTHQLRVHLSEMGHPILGDALYARRFRCALAPERHLLHARQISLAHPVTGEALSISAPRPKDFSRALFDLRRSSKQR